MTTKLEAAARQALNMNQCRKTFEALMRSKGHQDFTVTASGMYKVPSLQVRWNYFQLGWNLAEANR